MGDDDSNVLKLGGNIVLAGFSDIEGANMIVVKKLVGNYARKISDAGKDFQELRVTLKTIHKKEKSELYELHGKIIDKGDVFTSEVTDRNLFFAIDKLMKKLLSEMGA